jgi:septal ring-binding cell division protein DamX
VQIGRYILLILICLLLQSCASTYNAERLQGGKVSFMAGDFKSAFHQLLPLAAEGVPQAEYGVGYMYYYGYGVTQDSESGIFWMNKAANAHYPPAIKALAAIQENNLKQGEAPSPYSSYKGEEKPLSALPPVSQQGHVTVMPEPEKPTVAKTADSVMPDTFPKKYTLQLLGSYDLVSLKSQQTQHNLSDVTYIGQTEHNGRDWYVLTYGKYSSISSAEIARYQLPQKIKDFKPWIRKLDELKQVG